jgi:hypothetical protein
MGREEDVLLLRRRLDELAVFSNHLPLLPSVDGRVALKRHRELSLALGHAAEGRRVTEHVGEGDFAGCGELLVARFGVDDSSLALIDSSNDGT